MDGLEGRLELEHLSKLVVALETQIRCELRAAGLGSDAVDRSEPERVAQ
jgi:hypothetical protein